MPHRVLPSTADRYDDLRSTERVLLEEVGQLRREEEYLELKVQQAREQVRYYERLLDLLKRDWGKDPGLATLVQRFG